MKKLIALMLALAVALSTSFVFAEQAQEAPATGLILSSSVSVERDAAGQLMNALDFGEDRRAVVDSSLAVLNAVHDRLIIAENGVDYRLGMNDTDLVSVTGGMTDEGFVLMSSLIPNYALTLSADTIGKIARVCGLLKQIRTGLKHDKKRIAIAKALETLLPYIEGFLGQATSAVRPGAPEKGVFDFGEGISYNTRQPFSIDGQFFNNILNVMISKIVRDEKAIAALNLLGIPLNEVQKLPVVSERLPVIDMTLYTHTDDSGAEISPNKCFSFAVTLPGQDTASAALDLHMREKQIDAALSIPGSGTNDGVTATFTFAPFDLETAVGSIALAVDANARYFALSGVITPNQDDAALTLSNALFIQDPVRPLAAATTTIEASDASLDLSIGKREAIPLESLFGKSGENARKNLKFNFMFSGLRIIAAATEAVPEVADLLQMINGETKAAADMKESEMAKDAA